MLSVVVPVYNEEGALEPSLRDLSRELTGLVEHEIIVVNDGSQDRTRAILDQLQLPFMSVVHHPENMGYGKSLFDGILQSKYDCIAIIDGDGTYPPSHIKELLQHYPAYDMVVGARVGDEYRRGIFKRPARFLFNQLCEYATGRKIPDTNSGLRIFRKDVPLRFRKNICAGFSFTTTLTLIFFLNLYAVKYVPVPYLKRDKGDKSKVNHWKDSLRAAQIIVEAILEYNPTKLALLLATANFFIGISIGLINALTFDFQFLNMAAAFCCASFIPIFAIGLLRPSGRS